MINGCNRYINVYGDSHGRLCSYSISYDINSSCTPHYEYNNIHNTNNHSRTDRNSENKGEGNKTEKED